MERSEIRVTSITSSGGAQTKSPAERPGLDLG
jgi:hypothetical protein